MWAIPKISNLENFKNFLLGKFQKIPRISNLKSSTKFQEFLICKIPKNSKNFQLRKFQKIPRISNLETFENCQFGKIRKFPISEIPENFILQGSNDF